MHKKHSVFILLSIQLAAAVILALINPIGDYIVRSKGTEYTFEASPVSCYGDYTDKMYICCHAKYAFDHNRFTDSRNYAVIETDKNGLSYISELTDTRPESSYLGTKHKSHLYFDNFTQELDYNIFKKSFKMNPPLFDRDSASDGYNFTFKAYVYNGKAVLDKILVNGIEINEFLANQKE